MFGQKARKRLEKQAKESEKPTKCACGNHCGADGLCNACRNAGKSGYGSASKEPAKPAPAAVQAKVTSSRNAGTRAAAAEWAVLSSCG